MSRTKYTIKLCDNTTRQFTQFDFFTFFQNIQELIDGSPTEVIPAASTAAEGSPTEQPGSLSTDTLAEPPVSNSYYPIRISDAAMQRFFADGRIYPKDGQFYLRD